MMSRSCGMVSAALIAVRRCEPFSSPFVYQEFSARSLLITHFVAAARRRWQIRTGLTGRDVAEAVGLVDALVEQQIDVLEQEAARGPRP